jgi:hypothetical protein
MNLIFRLPQTLIRSLGISELDNYNFFLANTIRSTKHIINSTEVEKSVFRVATEIVYAINKDSRLNYLNLYEENAVYPLDATVDYNLIQSFENLKKIKKISLLPYDSLVLNPEKHDLIYMKSFLKGIKDCFTIWKFVKPEVCYNWIDMITKNETKNYLPWFWKPQKLDLKLYLSRVKVVAKHLALKYEFMNEFLKAYDPIYIQYTKYPGAINLTDRLDCIYESSELFRSKIKNKNCAIFVKPHRSVPYIKSEEPEYYKGVRLFLPNNLDELLIPSELFINSKENPFLIISEWSSSLFNFQVETLIPIKNHNDKFYFMRMRMANRRLSKYFDLEDIFA